VYFVHGSTFLNLIIARSCLRHPTYMRINITQLGYSAA